MIQFRINEGRDPEYAESIFGLIKESSDALVNRGVAPDSVCISPSDYDRLHRESGDKLDIPPLDAVRHQAAEHDVHLYVNGMRLHVAGVTIKE